MIVEKKWKSVENLSEENSFSSEVQQVDKSMEVSIENEINSKFSNPYLFRRTLPILWICQDFNCYMERKQHKWRNNWRENNTRDKSQLLH